MRNEAMIKERAKVINWNTTVFMALFHVGAVAALFMFKWPALVGRSDDVRREVA